MPKTGSIRPVVSIQYRFVLSFRYEMLNMRSKATLVKQKQRKTKQQIDTETNRQTDRHTTTARTALA